MATSASAAAKDFVQSLKLLADNMRSAAQAAGVAAAAHTAMPEAFRELRSAMTLATQTVMGQFTPFIVEAAAQLLTFAQMVDSSNGTLGVWSQVAEMVIGVMRSLARSFLYLVEAIAFVTSKFVAIGSEITGIATLMRATGMRGPEWSPMKNSNDISSKLNKMFDDVTGMNGSREEWDKKTQANRDSITRGMRQDRPGPAVGFSGIGDMWKKMQEAVNQSDKDARDEKRFQDVIQQLEQANQALREGNRAPVGAFG